MKNLLSTVTATAIVLVSPTPRRRPGKRQTMDLVTKHRNRASAVGDLIVDQNARCSNETGAKLTRPKKGKGVAESG